jgi:CRISPR-associated protein Cas2
MTQGSGSDWRAALAEWENKDEGDGEPVMAGKVVAGWWLEAFANPPSSSAERGHQCGEKEMLIVIAYDISNHKRLAQVARHCEDHGLRVQYSIFECRMEIEEFEMFWMGMEDLIDPDEDRIVAYRICANCAQRIFSAGTMQTNQSHIAYVF